jgi:hypothetical protein
LPGIITSVGRCDGRVAFPVRDTAVLMARFAMRLVEIASSRPSANMWTASKLDSRTLVACSYAVVVRRPKK